MKRLFPFLFLILGAFLLAWSGQEMLKAKNSSNWPTVEGKIIGSTIDQQRRVRGNQNGVRRLQYRAKINYQYQVDGTTYEANKVTFGEGVSFTKAPVQAIQSKYPMGASIPVYYQPTDPSEAVLEPGMNTRMTMLPIAGLAFLVFGSLGFRKKRKA